jgi:hypothetical protein
MTQDRGRFANWIALGRRGPRRRLAGLLLLAERMDFWSGAFAGGRVADPDPFQRYRSGGRRVGRTILGALVGGVLGQPISERDLLRYGLSRGRPRWTGMLPEWLQDSRPPIERRVPPRRR